MVITLYIFVSKSVKPISDQRKLLHEEALWLVFGSDAAAGVCAHVDQRPLGRLRLGLTRLQLLRSHAKRSMYTYLRHLLFLILTLGDRLFYLLIHFGSGVRSWRKGAPIWWVLLLMSSCISEVLGCVLCHLCSDGL